MRDKHPPSPSKEGEGNISVVEGNKNNGDHPVRFSACHPSVEGNEGDHPISPSKEDEGSISVVEGNHPILSSRIELKKTDEAFP